MFSSTAPYYDLIYSFKDYSAEAEQLVRLIGDGVHSQRRRLLDVACGTGRHIEHLNGHFFVEGLDINAELLDLARERNPGVSFHHGDMVDFDLGRRFGIVTCLFSSIGYVRTLENLARATHCMASHLAPGGILIIEPWFTPEAWRPNTIHSLYIEQPELKIARVNTSFVEGRLSYFDLHYLIGTPEGTQHFVEHHELGLFTVEEMQAALSHAGLDAEYDPEGLTGRGLHLGRLPG